ncbi:MAG: DUF1214 domain-containing protein [Halioglobus sp.]
MKFVKLRLFLVVTVVKVLLFSNVVSALENIDKDTVADAYIYLLGRALVVRQENSDLQEPGIDYNVIKYNPIGSADFANPNLDVAYLEAWIAVDDETTVLLEVPEIEGRYYGAQILNEWGEVITNINERNFPSHPSGKFAFVAPGSTVEVPDGAERIELHSRKAKMLARVELRGDVDGAVELQKQFKLTALGKPQIEPAVALPSFGNKDLPGVEIFDNAEALMTGALDTSPVAAQMQARVRDIVRQASDPAKRKTLDQVIQTEIVPEFLQYSVTKSGVFENNWLGTLGTGNYGSDYWKRASANLVGIWANTNDEVVYFVAVRDADGEPLNGANDYIIDFPADARPDAVVDSYWSVILVDVPDYRVVPNPLNRFNLNSESPLKNGTDGALKILLSSKPNAAVPESNWLPAPSGRGFSLTLRTYVPKDIVKRGEWFPPAIKRLN